MTRFRESPARWFALLGAPFLAVSFLFAGLALLSWGAGVVAPAVAVFSLLVFVSCLLAGLLGEVIIHAGGRRSGHRLLFREWGAQE